MNQRTSNIITYQQYELSKRDGSYDQATYLGSLLSSFNSFRIHPKGPYYPVSGKLITAPYYPALIYFGNQCGARLHNWCIDHRAPYVRYVRAAYAERGDRDQSGNSAPIFASRSNQGRPGPPVKNAMRDKLAAELVDLGMVRPKRSMVRRRIY